MADIVVQDSDPQLALVRRAAQSRSTTPSVVNGVGEDAIEGSIRQGVAPSQVACTRQKWVNSADDPGMPELSVVSKKPKPIAAGIETPIEGSQGLRAIRSVIPEREELEKTAWDVLGKLLLNDTREIQFVRLSEPLHSGQLGKQVTERLIARASAKVMYGNRLIAEVSGMEHRGDNATHLEGLTVWPEAAFTHGCSHNIMLEAHKTFREYDQRVVLKEQLTKVKRLAFACMSKAGLWSVEVANIDGTTSHRSAAGLEPLLSVAITLTDVLDERLLTLRHRLDKEGSSLGELAFEVLLDFLTSCVNNASFPVQDAEHSGRVELEPIISLIAGMQFVWAAAAESALWDTHVGVSEMYRKCKSYATMNDGVRWFLSNCNDYSTEETGDVVVDLPATAFSTTHSLDILSQATSAAVGEQTSGLTLARNAIRRSKVGPGKVVVVRSQSVLYIIPPEGGKALVLFGEGEQRIAEPAWKAEGSGAKLPAGVKSVNDLFLAKLEEVKWEDERELQRTHSVNPNCKWDLIVRGVCRRFISASEERQPLRRSVIGSTGALTKMDNFGHALTYMLNSTMLQHHRGRWTIVRVGKLRKALAFVMKNTSRVYPTSIGLMGFSVSWTYLINRGENEFTGYWEEDRGGEMGVCVGELVLKGTNLRLQLGRLFRGIDVDTINFVGSAMEAILKYMKDLDLEVIGPFRGWSSLRQPLCDESSTVSRDKRSGGRNDGSSIGENLQQLVYDADCPHLEYDGDKLFVRSEHRQAIRDLNGDQGLLDQLVEWLEQGREFVRLGTQTRAPWFKLAESGKETSVAGENRAIWNVEALSSEYAGLLTNLSPTVGDGACYHVYGLAENSGDIGLAVLDANRTERHQSMGWAGSES